MDAGQQHQPAAELLPLPVPVEDGHSNRDLSPVVTRPPTNALPRPPPLTLQDSDVPPSPTLPSHATTPNTHMPQHARGWTCIK